MLIQLDWNRTSRYIKTCFGRFKQHAARTFALLFAVGLCLSLVLSACSSSNAPNSNPASAGKPSQGKEKVVRIGYQKSGSLYLLKTKGGLEKRLAPLGVGVEWTEFTAGPPLLEALSVGSLDFGQTGDAPPIFAQAAGSPLVYVANTKPSPESVAIIVPKNSPIRQLTDLKGKKVGFTKGSSAHYLVVQALGSVNLQPDDIKTVYLSPSDARAAFEKSGIDAWAIWDPFYAAAQRDAGARVLVDGKGLTPFREFYLASQTFANNRADLIEPIVQEIQNLGDWAIANPRAVAEFLAPKLRIDVAILEQAERRRKRYGAQLIEQEAIAEQQQIADTFSKLKLIPKQINIKDAVVALKQQKTQ